MAGQDYVSCNKCGKRLFYDGQHKARLSLLDMQETTGLTCDKCVIKLEKKIELLKKYDKRRH